MIRLSASAFDIVWTDLGFACPPAPLRVPSVGATDRERADIRGDVYRNLGARGLCVGDRLDEVLLARLETLAGAEVYVECEALIDLDAEAPLRAVAAAGGKRAVLATQPSRTIGLSAIRETEIPAAVVDLVPGLEPGPGYGVSLPASVLGARIDDPVFGDGGGTSSYQTQIREVLAIQARPVLGAGQFSVRVRRDRRLCRTGGVSWFRTDVGAYFGTIAEGRGGQDWVTVAPADPRRLAARLAELLP
ncbi:ESX secretion-associated protein EspG [Amycolatopsis taiwanensis]|uniref:ESX secretion-associated protein EspG n=1 Tax=Amycolatopsis taiwanensis TaxID=342230 RepID=A0A9W6R524_9PSEU|nr:ESX secretion-associated protein EspG [Amycolatopsis taiwanensis]GLY69393.1 ESX secretion-associated protein EspG [Amycolatopsis taiwanensis]